jgi:hypothetical protein
LFQGFGGGKRNDEAGLDLPFQSFGGSGRAIGWAVALTWHKSPV